MRDLSVMLACIIMVAGLLMYTFNPTPPFPPLCYEDEVILSDGTCHPRDDSYFEGNGPGGYWYPSPEGGDLK